VHELVIIETGHIDARFKHEVCCSDLLAILSLSCNQNAGLSSRKLLRIIKNSWFFLVVNSKEGYFFSIKKGKGISFIALCAKKFPFYTRVTCCNDETQG